MSGASKIPKLLKPKEVAQLLAIPDGTLRYWRNIGIGPAFVKLEGSIRYDLGDVLRYIEQRRRIPSVRAHMEENDAL
jgi:DNA-binding transcriptional MerR regulator